MCTRTKPRRKAFVIYMIPHVHSSIHLTAHVRSVISYQVFSPALTQTLLLPCLTGACRLPIVLCAASTLSPRRPLSFPFLLPLPCPFAGHSLSFALRLYRILHLCSPICVSPVLVIPFPSFACWRRLRRPKRWKFQGTAEGRNGLPIGIKRRRRTPCGSTLRHIVSRVGSWQGHA